MTIARTSWLLRWSLFAVAIAAVLSHVCVLPHAHAAEPAAAETHDHDEPGDAAGDAVHGASCDVVRTAPTQLAALCCASGRGAPRVEPTAHLVVHAPALVARGPSPPLFILHASLLI